MKTAFLTAIALIAASLNSVVGDAACPCDPKRDPGCNRVLEVEPVADPVANQAELVSVLEDSSDSVWEPAADPAPSRLVSVFDEVPCPCDPKTDPTCD